jgi:hypothetical protein
MAAAASERSSQDKIFDLLVSYDQGGIYAIIKREFPNLPDIQGLFFNPTRELARSLVEKGTKICRLEDIDQATLQDHYDKTKAVFKRVVTVVRHIQIEKKAIREEQQAQQREPQQENRWEILLLGIKLTSAETNRMVGNNLPSVHKQEIESEIQGVEDTIQAHIQQRDGQFPCDLPGDRLAIATELYQTNRDLKARCNSLIKQQLDSTSDLSILKTLLITMEFDHNSELFTSHDFTIAERLVDHAESVKQAPAELERKKTEFNTYLNQLIDEELARQARPAQQAAAADN